MKNGKRRVSHAPSSSYGVPSLSEDGSKKKTDILLFIIITLHGRGGVEQTVRYGGGRSGRVKNFQTWYFGAAEIISYFYVPTDSLLIHHTTALSSTRKVEVFSQRQRRRGFRV